MSYDNRNGLAFGLNMGVTSNAFINYIPEPLDYKSGLTYYYGVQPSFDFGNWALQPNFSFYSHPSISGKGSGYTESSNANTFALQMRLLFIPVYFNSLRQRFYFGTSMGVGETIVDNKSKYDSGPSYDEQLKGTGTIFNSFLGFESFLAQNYTAGLELGWRNYFVDNLKYKGNLDADGTSQTPNTEKNFQGHKVYFSFRGVFAQLNLTVHF